MAEDKYQYDKDGFREDLKERKDVLHQPDADRSAWDLTVLDYDQTMAVLKDEKKVQPTFSFDDQVLKRVRQENDKIGDDDVNSVIEDKYQQILLARYNVSHEKNITVHQDSGQDQTK